MHKHIHTHGNCEVINWFDVTIIVYVNNIITLDILNTTFICQQCLTKIWK